MKLGLSIGGETIAFSMQAEARHMTLDEAVASGLFDLPDEPGMVRIPVALEVSIPHHVLYPQHSRPGSELDNNRNGVPPASGTQRPRTRFGNYPRATAALNVARRLQTAAAAQSEVDAFRDMLKALRTGRTAPLAAPPATARQWSDGPLAAMALRTPDGTPVRRVQAEEEETRAGPGGREPSPVEAAREDSFDSAVARLKALEPASPALTWLRSPGWVPDEAAVERMEREVTAAEARAAARSCHLSQGPLPEHPTPDLLDTAAIPGSTPPPGTLAKGDSTDAGLPPLPSNDDADTTPRVRLGHVLDGDINAAGKAGGFHSRPEGKDPASARMTEIVDKPDKVGVYTGRVEVRNPVTDQFVPKTANSSFFPDTLSRDQITAAILKAFHNSGLVRDGQFTGDSGLGFKIRGWYVNGKIKTSYPLRKDN